MSPISSKTIENFPIAYETYGELNDNKDNAVLICHALSGNHHVAGYHEGDDKPGWWDNMVGSGKPINTNKLFVVCVNNIGGCHGSTGPASINTETGTNYGFDFPVVTVQDWVNSQKVLMDNLDINKWQFVVGGSLGGMQAFQWALDYPDYIDNAIIIAAAPKLTAQNIAFNEVARQAIMNDPDWCGGNYLKEDKMPKRGLGLARMLGHITYLSEELMDSRFGRKFQDEDSKVDEDVNFEVENYLQYKGSKFSELFDANTYILMTKAMDEYDAGNSKGLDQALRNIKSELLIIGFYSDWLYPYQRGKEIQIAAMNNNIKSSFLVFNGENGHDSFLFSSKEYSNVIEKFIES